MLGLHRSKPRFLATVENDCWDFQDEDKVGLRASGFPVCL